MTVPAGPWRVAIVSRILPVVLGFESAIREAGHEPVALLSVRDLDDRYGGAGMIAPLVGGAPPTLDVLFPSGRERIAPLLEAARPDLVVCMGFPWKIPPAALAVPRLGWLNGHPSLLPRHRGPIPVAWAIRDGDAETGITFHRMDAELDTGAIMAQSRFPIGDYRPPDDFYGELGPLVLRTLGEALARLGSGEEGEPQAGGDYQSFFPAADARLDLSRPALELHRLVWGWRYAGAPRDGDRIPGALLELDGATVRVLASSLAETDGARRVECGDGPLWIVETEPVSAA